MSDIELISFILKGFAAFGLSMMLFALLPKTRARRFIICLISCYMFVTFAKSLAQRELGNLESAANFAGREQLSALMSEKESDDACGDDDNEDEDDDIYDYVIIDDEYEEEEEIVERVDIAAILYTNGVVSVEFKWPQDMEIHKWDVFLKGYAELNGEETLSKKYNPTSGTNLVVIVTAADFPENILPHKHFFKVVTIKDSDHDGLSDEDEILWRTNPEQWDSDGDGISDGDEVDACLNPTTDDSDGDGLLDCNERDDGFSALFNDSDVIQPDPSEGPFYVVTGAWNIVSTPRTNPTSRSVIPVVYDSSDPSGVAFDVSWSDKADFVAGGKFFVPLRTGEYTFQIQSDDVGSLTVGTVVARAEYPNIGEPVSGVFVAGQSYEITAELYNDGGPAGIHSVTFGAYTALRMPSLEMSLGSDAFIFQKPYQNVPSGKIYKKHSNVAFFEITAFGGPFGSELVIATQNDRKLKVRSGKSYDIGRIDLGPNMPYVRRCLVDGEEASEYENDVGIKAILTDNLTGLAITNEVRATVVEMEIVKRAFLGNRTRHIFGPNEDVQLLAYPKNDTNIEWFVGYSSSSITNSSIIKSPSIVGKRHVECKYKTTRLGEWIYTIKPKERIAIGYKDNRKFDWKRIPPKGLHYPPRELWGCCCFDMKLLPDYVSFENIIVREGFCRAEGLEGSYQFKTNIVHGADNGAFVEIGVNESNELKRQDIAAHDNILKTNGVYQAGRFYFPIPVQWKTKDSNMSWKTFTVNTQEVRIVESQELRVSKFGHTATRREGDVNDDDEDEDDEDEW